MIDVVIVEDNQELGEIIQDFLIAEGYLVQWFTKGEAALVFLRREQVRMVLLDIMLADSDGYTICQRLRKESAIPILMMSARSAIADKLLGYELGADDYIEKPFAIELLLAKIKSMLRRLAHALPQGIIEDGELIIHQDEQQVLWQGKQVNLSHKEYELLLLFIHHKGKVLRKEFLFQSVWGDLSVSELATLTVHINTLREKLEADPRHPQRIKTVWGIGYQYVSI